MLIRFLPKVLWRNSKSRTPLHRRRLYGGRKERDPRRKQMVDRSRPGQGARKAAGSSTRDYREVGLRTAQGLQSGSGGEEPCRYQLPTAQGTDGGARRMGLLLDGRRNLSAGEVG